MFYFLRASLAIQSVLSTCLQPSAKYSKQVTPSPHPPTIYIYIKKTEPTHIHTPDFHIQSNTYSDKTFRLR